MEIVFLAAGLGRRMGSHTEGLPKVLFPLGDGRTILETNLDNLAALAKPPGVVLVTGYHGDQVVDVVRKYSGKLKVRVVHNPAFESRGPSVSALTGLGEIEDDSAIAVANGDTVFSTALLAQVLEDDGSQSPLLCASRVSRPNDDDVLVHVDHSGEHALEAGKKIPSELADGVSSGLICAPNASAARLLRSAFEKVAHAEREAPRQLHWHTVVKTCAESDQPVRVSWIAREQWQEFDAPADIHAYNNRFGSVG